MLKNDKISTLLSAQDFHIPPKWLETPESLDSIDCLNFFEPLTADGRCIFNSINNRSIKEAKILNELDKIFIGTPFDCLQKRILNGDKKAEDLFLNYIEHELTYFEMYPNKEEHCHYSGYLSCLRSKKSIELFLRLSIRSFDSASYSDCNNDLIANSRNAVLMRIKSISGTSGVSYFFNSENFNSEFDKKYDQFYREHPNYSENQIWMQLYYPFIKNKLMENEISLINYNEELDSRMMIF